MSPHRDEFKQRGLIDELVEKHHVVFDAEFAYARHQALAIEAIALFSNQIGWVAPSTTIYRVRTGVSVSTAWRRS